MSSMNLNRARWASVAVEAFSNETGAELWPEAIGDLLCDIGHLCDTRGLDFEHVVASAIGVWAIEQEEPEGVSGPYQVSIIVSGRKQPGRHLSATTGTRSLRKGRGGAQ